MKIKDLDRFKEILGSKMDVIAALRSVGIDFGASNLNQAVDVLIDSELVPGSNPQAMENALKRWARNQDLVQLIIEEHQVFDPEFEAIVLEQTPADIGVQLHSCWKK